MAGKCREIQMLYSHDRLGDEKISQIYRMLVPEKIWKNRVAQGGTHEDSGTLCTGIIGEAKRGTDDREPDGGPQGVCTGQWFHGGAGVDIPG
jgi:hypothetical protein